MLAAIHEESDASSKQVDGTTTQGYMTANCTIYAIPEAWSLAQQPEYLWGLLCGSGILQVKLDIPIGEQDLHQDSTRRTLLYQSLGPITRSIKVATTFERHNVDPNSQ